MDVSIAILKILLKHKKMHLYELYSKYSIDIGNIVESITLLNNQGLIHIDDAIASITYKGKIKLFIEKDICYFKVDKYWLDIPDTMIQEAISVQEFYNPIKFDYNFFKETKIE